MILARVFLWMLVPAAIFILAAISWWTRSHGFRAMLSFIGLLLCLPMAVLGLIMLGVIR
jgi:hypothetical protein